MNLHLKSQVPETVGRHVFTSEGNNLNNSYLMLKTDRNLKCVTSHLQPAVPTPEPQILDLQVLVPTLIFFGDYFKIYGEHCFDMYSCFITVMPVESSSENPSVLIVNHFFQQVDRDKAIIVLVLHSLKKKTVSECNPYKVKTCTINLLHSIHEGCTKREPLEFPCKDPL